VIDRFVVAYVVDEILADPVKHGLDLGEKQAAEIERLQDYDTRLSAVMPADFKDWHQNSKNEWPEIAAWVITNLREREAEANAEIERKDALLRQALGALEKTRAFHQQDWSSEETTPKLTRDTIAAIKQHLGEA
jgi:TATA-binding protein-associated factor Taf7